MRAAILGVVAVIFLRGQPVHAASSHRKSEVAYARAENIRHRLDAKPLSQRTRIDYERALVAYRAVYHGDPASPDAGRSIAAVADLLAGAGRCFHDGKLSHDAIAQWEFLRREYPGSPLRERALFQEAQIEQHDLHNRAAAKKIYRDFLASYPHNSLAEQARANLDGAQDHPRVESSSPAELARESFGNQDAPPTRRAPQTSALQRHVAPKKQSDFEQSSEFPMESFPVVAKRENISQSPTMNDKPSQPANQHLTSSGDSTAATIQAVRYWTEGKSTRLAVDMNEAVPYHAYLAQNGKQITLVFFGAHPSKSLLSHEIRVAHDSNLRAIRANILTGDQAELVLELNHAANFSSFMLSNPNRLILDVHAVRQGGPTASISRAVARNSPATTIMRRKKLAEIPDQDRAASVHTEPEIPHKPAAEPTRIPVDDAMNNAGFEAAPQPFPEAPPSEEPAPFVQPATDGQRSMTRVLGLRIRRIVIDAGHGGHDSGTLGPGGLEEKNIALDVALRLGHLLHQRLGADVIYTRRTDKFIPLEERTAIANRAHADLFISIHANSSSDPDVRGVETYFLNFTASPDALQVAARENATSDRSVHELSDLVRKITLSAKIDESREFAGDVQQSLYTGLESGNAGLKNRGVKQAPFAVLIGANMPSILAEISFLTNPEDASELSHPAYRERLAESLYRGVAQYVEGMSGVRVAKTAQPEALPAPAE